MSYIGNKYTDVRDLKVCLDLNMLAIQDRELASNFPASALGNLKDFTSYSVNLGAPLKPALDVMDSNKV